MAEDGRISDTRQSRITSGWTARRWKNLTQVEAHIAKGHERIAQQHEFIAELDREGHDTAPAKDMLASFERTQAMHIANRDRIAGKLATLD